jgi:hypothetical protein
LSSIVSIAAPSIRAKFKGEIQRQAMVSTQIIPEKPSELEMVSIQLKHLSYAIVTASLMLFPAVAHAADWGTNYTSSSGSTRLLLKNEVGAAMGDYQTQISGTTWSGKIQTQRVLGHNGNRAFYGKFTDRPGRDLFRPNGGVSCTGDFVGVQTVAADRYVVQASWKVTGGTKCPTIGQTFNLQLVESLPVADSQGNFTRSNTATWFGLETGQNEVHTWDRWQVVDASGTLNCRNRPNGQVVRTYRQGDVFASRYDGRGIATAILGANNSEDNPSVAMQVKGDPWMLTQDRCFVRSNSRYIQPLSFSQAFNR